MQKHVGGDRRWVEVAVVVAVLLVGLVAGTWHPAQAAPVIPSGCKAINSDYLLDGFYWFATVGPAQFDKYDQITASAGLPSSGGPPITVTLLIDGSPVDTTSFPGTVSYRFRQSGVYDIEWRVDPNSNATWDISCDVVPPGAEPYTGIHLLSDAEQTPYMTVPNAEGATACGVFDVNGWGAKYVGMGDFPGCTAPVTVMCLNDQGEWTADNVSDMVMHGDWEVDFTSSQHGTCGLFEQ